MKCKEATSPFIPLGRRHSDRPWVPSLGMLIVLTIFPHAAAFASPEGTRNLSNVHGLLPETRVHVDATAGEILEFCSSDDGVNDTESIHPNCLGTAEACVDANGQRAIIDGEEERLGLVDADRSGSEILLYPPTQRPCLVDDDCPADNGTCRDQNGRSVSGTGDEGQCALSFQVRSEASADGGGRPAALGFCTALHDPDDRQWHRHIITENGVWTIDFAGEQATLNGLTTHGRYAGQPSTRFFEVQVLDPQGGPSVSPRIFSEDWAFTKHNEAYRSPGHFTHSLAHPPMNSN